MRDQNLRTLAQQREDADRLMSGVVVFCYWSRLPWRVGMVPGLRPFLLVSPQR